MCLVRRPMVGCAVLDLFLRQAEECVTLTGCRLCRAEAEYLRQQIVTLTSSGMAACVDPSLMRSADGALRS